MRALLVAMAFTACSFGARLAYFEQENHVVPSLGIMLFPLATPNDTQPAFIAGAQMIEPGRYSIWQVVDRGGHEFVDVFTFECSSAGHVRMQYVESLSMTRVWGSQYAVIQDSRFFYPPERWTLWYYQ